MSVSPQFATFLIDSLAGLGPVSVRRMFGGAGVFLDGVMFGLVADDTLYLRGEDAHAAAFAAEGKDRFVYQAKSGKVAAMPYWEAPERLFDDPAQLVAWASRAHGVALKVRRARK